MTRERKTGRTGEGALRIDEGKRDEDKTGKGYERRERL